METGRRTKATRYIWQRPDWPEWRYDLPALANLLSAVSAAQGTLYGRLKDAGMLLRNKTTLEALTLDVIQTSAIEGENLNPASVRSSIAFRLGVDIGALAPQDRNAEGVVDMVIDATSNPETPLTTERLFGWHAALFPTGYSGVHRICTGSWRTDSKGPMQVVSGGIGRERVHFQAPPAQELPAGMNRFLQWVNENGPDQNNTHDPALIRAGIGHLWFVTLHPFDDGNGRIARAIGDMLLSRTDGSPQRFYSLSAQIHRQRREYYKILERTQKGDMDVTPWLTWFLSTLLKAVENAHSTVDSVLARGRFWQQLAGIPLNQRQVMMLTRLLENFEGKLTTGKWATIAKCSSDTALRDINELVQHRILTRSSAGGRSTSYELKPR